MILEDYTVVVPVGSNWTLDAQASGGSSHVTDWHVLLLHHATSGTYRVVVIAKDTNVTKYDGLNNTTATEQYLLTVRLMTLEAQGVGCPTAA